MKSVSLQQLNRTLLSRQMLLRPSEVKPLLAIEQLVALQAQVASPPYFGLRSRLSGFVPGDLMELRDEGKVIRAPLLRSTLHWVSTRDYKWIRPVIQPALERAWQGFFSARKSGIGVEAICQAAKSILKQGALSLGSIGDELVKLFPQWDKAAMEYGVRTHLPLVQVSPAGSWKGGTAAKYCLVTVNAKSDPQKLVRRYLAAYGPASPKDIAVWAGFSAIGKVMESMRDELLMLQDHRGLTLYDLPGLDLVDHQLPCPVQYVAEYDNLVLAHADRSRILPDEHRKKVLLSAGRVLATVLIDGFVGGTWRVEKDKKAARLRVDLFTQPDRKLLRKIVAEAERLLEFASPEFLSREVDVR